MFYSGARICYGRGAMTWNETTDLLVIGSGGGGMTAALKAAALGGRALVVEKTASFGGSTAMSGGAVWIPCNHKMAAHGISDTPDEARTYLKHITRGDVSDARLDAYVEHAPAMIRWLEEHTRVAFVPTPKYPDYYPEAPGGKPGARSMEPVPFSAKKLGDDEPRLRRSAQGMVLGRIAITAVEAKTLVAFTFASYVLFAWRVLLYFLDVFWRFRTRADSRLTLGTALAGRLRVSLRDRNVPLWLESKAEELIVEDGRVVGAIVTRAGSRLRVKAERGVLLAAGGFERNQALRATHQQQPTTDYWTAGCEGNMGDGILMGQAVGAAVDLMDDAWWTPTTLLPGNYAWLLVVEKSMPGGIFVNAAGERFTNEAAPYVDVVKGMYAKNAPDKPSIPCWLVFDARYRRSYPCGPLGPSKLQPDSAMPGSFKKMGFLQRARSLAELAGKIGVDADGLERTVQRFNEQARAGKDTDFGRGDSLYDRYYADERAGINPSLAPLVEAPFYALRVYPGDLGTKGGLVTDAQARVLRADGSVIEGLYATGNCSAAVMGHTYPGAGGTIGPSMTFGYLAAAHALGERANATQRAAAE